MAQTTSTHLLELLNWLARASTLFRGRRQFAAVAHFEVARDIGADCAQDLRTVADSAYKAETYDREATRLIAAAQKPDSPGGPTVTPGEMLPIANLIARSAELDHDIADATAVKTEA